MQDIPFKFSVLMKTTIPPLWPLAGPDGRCHLLFVPRHWPTENTNIMYKND